jgi:CHAT domain-containing protein
MPHVTWCATGPLAFLPLHAAGIYDTKDPSKSFSASQYVISSYTPSFSALLAPHIQRVRHPSSLSSIPRVVAVSQPNTPGSAPLPCTTAEAAIIRQHLPSLFKHLDGNQATVDTVLNAMKEYNWVHLACHGIQDDEPTKSAFLLYDGRLELSRLMSVSLEHAELAVLSACQTAKGDERLPEEAVHLAAGMLGVGYRSVVATMWAINDADGPVLSDKLYAALKRNREEGQGLKVAHALHEAVEHLRETIGEGDFTRWVPFVHFGI